ncbi:hypothetical protein [Streptomyces bicolor]|uniref:hypothetical protein n=1 Tax=Streptomyces bicolor TaxID=66874 RepID=UPI0004E12E9D|nr:hypothetical protein [Streptomyces bicolor]
MGDKDVDNFEYVEVNQCVSEKHTTPFGLDYDMDQMKDMVRDADPRTVELVAEAWTALSKDLVGPGGIKESLDTAVQHVLAHWEGQSADLFRARAQVIGKKITDSSKYADNTSQSLKGAAAKLAEIKPQVMAMEKPSKLSSGADYIGNLGDRDGGPAADNAIRGGASSQQALDDNAGSLSEGKERQLQMAAKMEMLGAAYNSRARELGSWKPGSVNDSDTYPGDPGGAAPAPAPVIVPAGTATRSPQGATGGTARGSQAGRVAPSKPVAPPAGITGGAHKPTPPQPQVSTAIDGVSGGRPGAPTVGGASTVGGGSTGVGGGSGVVGGAAGGAVGAGAARGGMANRAGAAGMAGRAGAGGMGGAAGAGAAKGGAARAGGMARQSGGVVGGAPRTGAGAGRGTAGGSGLHSSRGAAGAAGRGAAATRKGGMVGVPGARTGRPKDQEQREGERPDYLVEDEETWAPQTNAAPRVIEE